MKTIFVLLWLGIKWGWSKITGKKMERELGREEVANEQFKKSLEDAKDAEEIRQESDAMSTDELLNDVLRHDVRNDE